MADAAAGLLVPRGQRWGRFAWELVFDLMARSFYRSDVAPDPLKTVMKDDRRFVDGGMEIWTLATTMTSEIADAIQFQKKTEASLFKDSVSDFELAPEAWSIRYAMERTLADVSAALANKGLASIDEANAFLRKLMAQGGLPHRTPVTALKEAQDLMYEAWESSSAKERVKLARRELKISPDCADAYVLLAEETARSAKEEADLYSKGVEAGARALGTEVFEEDAGHFWGLVSTMPYMRARLGLAQTFWEIGRQPEAIDHAWGLLRLNPGDDQGVRYLLLSWLVELSADAQLQKLLGLYPDDVSASWAYGQTLHAFHKLGGHEAE